MLAGYLLNSCAKRVKVDKPYSELVNRGSYAYKRLNDGEFMVEAFDHQALNAALDEIGCGKRYICLVEHNADVFDVLVRKK